MSPRIQRAIDVFLDALNEGTLKARSTCGCAVGNLILAGVRQSDDYSLEKNPHHEDLWIIRKISTGKEQWVSGWFCDLSHRNSNKHYQREDSLLNLCEFSWDELDQIERTFENTARDEGIVKALSAVVDLMLSFDNQEEDVFEIFESKIPENNSYLSLTPEESALL